MDQQKNRRRSGLGQSFRALFAGNAAPAEERLQSPAQAMAKNFLRNPPAITGVILFALIFLSCMILPFFFPLDKGYQDTTQQNTPPGFSLLKVPQGLKNNARAIDAGSTFSAGIDRQGNLYLWGNLSGKLKNMPRGMGKISQVSCGLDHILALSEEGTLYTWGYDRLGLGNIPQEVQNARILKIVAGYQISAALDDQGTLHLWGNRNIVSINPQSAQGQIQDFVLNTTTALALTFDGRVLCLSGKETVFSQIPGEVQGQTAALASTDKTAAALLKDGRVITWGSGDYGAAQVPGQIQGRVRSLQAGRGHFTALLEDGTLASWGLNNYSQAQAPELENIASISTDYFQNYAVDQSGRVHTWGLKGYLMGTDQFGRDVFSRLLSGGRITLTIGAISVVISALIGILIGGLAGYYGGKTDNFLMRLAEIVNAIPFLPLALILSALLGARLSETGRVAMIMVILGLLNWPYLARLVRGQVLAEREKEFVTAAKSMGIRQGSILLRHILPNVLTVALVNLTLSFSNSMLLESSLSFLGFGVVEPTPTWGNMLSGCQHSAVIVNYWWRWAFPSAALALCTIGVNLAGDGLRDAIDPKSMEQ